MTTDCDTYRDDLSAYLDGELAGEEITRIEAHLESCKPCTKLKGELETLIGKVQGIPSPAPVDLRSDVWRELSKPESTGSVTPTVIPLVRRLALAAVVLLGVALTWYAVSERNGDGTGDLTVVTAPEEKPLPEVDRLPIGTFAPVAVNPGDVQPRTATEEELAGDDTVRLIWISESESIVPKSYSLTLGFDIIRVPAGSNARLTELERDAKGRPLYWGQQWMTAGELAEFERRIFVESSARALTSTLGELRIPALEEQFGAASEGRVRVLVVVEQK